LWGTTKPTFTPTLAGAFLVNWPEICQHYDWGDHTKLCGPYVMSPNADPDQRLKRCVWGHPGKCSAHNVPKVGGKPFRLLDHRKDLMERGLCRPVPELKQMVEAGGHPKGNPKKVNGGSVYPAPHFRQPARA
jgi:hypothetical protein